MTSPKKSILIIGASGYLGQALYRYFQQTFSGKYLVTGTYYSGLPPGNLEKLDITSFGELEEVLVRLAPDFIVLAVGDKNVQGCEDDYSRAYDLNTRPVESIISIISRYGLSSRLIYLSTDYVFDGKTGQYQDSDTPNPTTNYGKTKYLAEQALIKSGVRFKIVRTAAVMGKGGTFFGWLIQKLKNEKQVSMYDNVFFSPTPLQFLVEMIGATLENYESIPQNILHIVGEKRISRYQFALLVSSILKSDVRIYAEKNLDRSMLFQPDLSMVPSDIINTWRKRDFEDYLKDEILHAAVYK
jgi:dTDP-4-dehydrorhamnose reductase